MFDHDLDFLVALGLDRLMILDYWKVGVSLVNLSCIKLAEIKLLVAV